MKMNKRVLFWDIAPNKELIPDITSHLKDCDVFSEPQYAFYDFDIVIINLPNFRKRIYSLHKSCEDINTALRAGKIIFCIIDVIYCGNARRNACFQLETPLKGRLEILAV